MTAGSDYVITTTFRDSDGNLANPDTVDALVQAPNGDQSSPTPTSSTTGIWVTTGPADQAGIWFYQITGISTSGTVISTGSFCVEPGLALAS